MGPLPGCFRLFCFFFCRMRRLPFIILHPHLGAPFLLLEIVLVANIDPKIGGNFPSPELSLTLLGGYHEAEDKPMLGMVEIYRHAVKPALRRFGGAFPRGCHTVQMSRLNRP